MIKHTFLPFDLEKTLHGAPVYTRNHQPVSQLAKFTLGGGNVLISGIMDGCLYTRDDRSRGAFSRGPRTSRARNGPRLRIRDMSTPTAETVQKLERLELEQAQTIESMQHIINGQAERIRLLTNVSDYDFSLRTTPSQRRGV
jgi:hypothetical protein